MRRHNLQETLVSLYLRLNGYFVSGFIVHAPGTDEAGNRTQIDALGVRFPYNSEPEREVLPSEYLQIPIGVTDILLCEVKGQEASVQFNDALRRPESIRSTLRWIGAFDAKDIEALLEPTAAILAPRDPDTPTVFPAVTSPDHRYQLRPILFALDRPAPRRNQTRYVHGQELVGFINTCLRAKSHRVECTTRYDFGLWGAFYEPIVRLVKNAAHDVTLQEIYETFLDQEAK